MQPNPYNKVHATAAELVAHLRARGLQINRQDVAADRIEEFGYERLRIYFLSRRDHTRPGKPFLPGTTFDHILRLHECDTELRDICFMGVGRFELVFRNRLSEVLSARFGSHPYFRSEAFAGSSLHNEALQKLLQVFNQSKDQRADHYRTTYAEPPLPPIWMLKEFLTFGASTRLHAALACSVRTEIAAHFGVTVLPVFDSWVRCFVDLRNICAHHDRLFNRRFQRQPRCLRRTAIPIASPSTLKAQLECLDHALTSANAAGNLVDRVQKVLDRYPEVRNTEAGY